MAIDRTGRWADPETACRVLAQSTDRTDDVVAFEGVARLDERLVNEDFDVAFPVLHGPFGEDGTIQGLFEMLDIPYVGCDTASSAVCMDKIFCKRLLAQAGLPTPPWVEIDRTPVGRRDARTSSARCLDLGLPLFVKPARLGSSVGITKVKRPDELRAAQSRWRSTHGRRVLVERGIDAREIEVAVLGNDHPGPRCPARSFPATSSTTTTTSTSIRRCELLAPAPLERGGNRSRHGASRSRSSDARLRRDGAGRSLSRAQAGGFWVNEVNTIPGFTSISMYPRLWGLTGLDYPSLLDELMRLAREAVTEPSPPVFCGIMRPGISTFFASDRGLTPSLTGTMVRACEIFLLRFHRWTARRRAMKKITREEALAYHTGKRHGKTEVVADQTVRHPARSVAGLHPRRRRALSRDRHATPSWSTSTPTRAISWRWSPTAPPSSVSATSAPWPASR